MEEEEREGGCIRAIGVGGDKAGEGRRKGK